MKIISVRNKIGIIAAILVIGFIASGCDDDTIITPFSDREAYFSLFGFISIADTQLVRVIPIRNGLDRDAVATSLDVTVQTTRLSDGIIEKWEQVLPELENGDRGLAFSDSTFGHVFRAFFTPFIGETYRLEVIRNDGKTSSAEVRIPPVSSPLVSDVWTRNDTVFQSVTWPDVHKLPMSAQMVYRVNSELFYPEIQFPTIPLDYTGRGYDTADGWQYDIDLITDVALGRQYIADNLTDFSPLPVVEDVDTFDYHHIDVRMRVQIADSLLLQLEDGLSLSRLAQPGAFSNVENGFGFFGAAGTNSRFWELPRDTEFQQLLGFTR